MPMVLAGVAILLVSGVNVRAEEEKKFLFDAYVKLDAQAERAITRAQKWVASRQRSDGSWNTGHGRHNTGEISFAILALMVNGSVPGEGPYGTEIGLGLQFLLNQQKESGIISGGEDSKAPMYQHALATVTLAEAFGMTQNPRIRKALINAVNLIVEVQHSMGGWRYEPRIEEGDISASVMQVMALRAASESGIHVPDGTIARAIKFIKLCYDNKEHGFFYQRFRNRREGPEFPRTAAGLVCLQTVGLHDDPSVPDIVQYLLKNGFNDRMKFYWYGHYYASVALYHYGGSPWKTYYPKIKQKILSDWKRHGHHGGLLDTSWAILVLGVPYRYLPIYQR